MPNIRPEYEQVNEFPSIASSLVAKYPDIFPGVEIDKMRCVAITNKERGEDKKLWEIRAVPMPIRMDCPYAYYVILFMSDWVNLSTKHRQLLVSDILCAIPADGEEGKIIQPDMKDFAVMLRTFGVDYLQKPADELTDLINDTVKWIT